MWMNKYNTVDCAGKVILLRGVKQPAIVVKTSATPVLPNTVGVSTIQGEIDPATNKPKLYEILRHYDKDIVIKAPLIKFGVNENQLIVQFNTVNNPHTEVTINAPIMKLMSTNTWSLLTFTFEDYRGLDGFESGVQFKFFVNDTEMHSQRFKDDALLLNADPVYLFPSLPADKSIPSREAALLTQDWSSLQGSIADVTYYNFALQSKDLTDILHAGYNNSTYLTPGMRSRSTTYDNIYHASLSASLQNI